MAKTGQIRRWQSSLNLGDWLCATQKMIFFNCISTNKFYIGTKFGYVKKHKLFATVFTRDMIFTIIYMYWVNPACLAEPMLLTSTLLMGPAECRRPVDL